MAYHPIPEPLFWDVIRICCKVNLGVAMDPCRYEDGFKKTESIHGANIV